MNIKQKTLQDIIDSEKGLLLSAKEDYGEYFDNACGFNSLLNNFIKSLNDPEKYIFLAFYSQIKKNHTLALFSSIRLHHVQTGMNLRQFIEASSWAIYAMGNKEIEKFCDSKSSVLKVSKKHSEERNKWLIANYKDASEKFNIQRKIINGSLAHSNIVYTFQNFKTNPEKFGFDFSFFDEYDDFRVKTDLWTVGNFAMGLLDLMYSVNNDYNVFNIIDDFFPKFRKLVNQNNKLKQEMMNHPRFKKSIKNNS
ncbi:MAG: hypothetical protein PHQ01_01415 [Candidatus Pacebacteria bacterium]|nr:hypothetical protein [Candidatus Paceibacterota bacterium]